MSGPGQDGMLQVGLLTLTLSTGGPAATLLVDTSARVTDSLLVERSVEAAFRTLVDGWRAERRKVLSSDFMRMVTHPSYQQIIGLGDDAVPLILAELRAKPDHWGWALEMITRENPVPPEAEGNLREIAKAWLAWGAARGLV